MGKNKPAHEIKLGCIRATIWDNGVRDGESSYTAQVTRSYKADNGWKETTSLRREDLPVAVKAMDMAYGWMWRRNAVTTSSAQAVIDRAVAASRRRA